MKGNFMYLNQVTAEQKKAAKGSGNVFIRLNLKGGDIFEAIFKKPALQNLQRFLNDKEESKDGNFTPMLNYCRDLVAVPEVPRFIEIIKTVPQCIFPFYDKLSVFLGSAETTETEIL
jgi:hypothetical protein